MQKFTIDIPLIAKINQNLKIQGLYPDEPILERLAFLGKSMHDCAAGYLALWIWRGSKPPFDERLDGAIRLAETIVANIPQYRAIPEVVSLFECQNRLVTMTHYRPDGSLTFIGVEPSREARKQAKAERDRQGSNHQGARLVRKKERCKVGDSRYPQHWRNPSFC